MSRFAALILLATYAPACGQTNAPMPPTPDASAIAETPGLMGRYRFELPQGFVWTDGSVSYEYFNSRAEPWPGAALEGEARAAAFAAAVAERLAFVQSNEPPSELEGVVETAFIETREVDVPGARTVWAALSYDGPYGTEEARRWDVLLDAGPVLVEAEYVSEDAPDESLAVVAERLSAVRVPGDPGFGEQDWLYGGGYALALPEGDPESTSAGYKGPLGSLGGGTLSPTSLDIPLRVGTAMQEREIEGRLGPEYRARVLRSRDRTAAGLAGEEVVREVLTPTSPSVQAERNHEWWYQRIGHEITLTFAAIQRPGDPPLPPEEATTPVWDALVDSLHPVTP